MELLDATAATSYAFPNGNQTTLGEMGISRCSERFRSGEAMAAPKPSTWWFNDGARVTTRRGGGAFGGRPGGKEGGGVIARIEVRHPCLSRVQKPMLPSWRWRRACASMGAAFSDPWRELQVMGVRFPGVVDTWRVRWKLVRGLGRAVLVMW